MREIFNLDNEQIIQQYLIKPVEQYLDLERWGFKKSYASYKNGYEVIYDSSCCRLSCTLSFDPRDEYDSILTSYGRLHALNDEQYMIFQGEKCNAWHGFVGGYVGQFLDGMSPSELGNLRNKRIQVLSQPEEIFNIKWEDKGLHSPEWGLRKTQFVWEYYDNRLFELFDLHHNDLWQQYRRFLYTLHKELIKNPTRKQILEDQPDWEPYPWQVC